MKKLLDNGTLITLGLVGAVAAIGVAAKRGVYGSRAKHMGTVGGGMEFVHGQHGGPPKLRMRSLEARLNDHGFAFEEMERGLLVDDAHDIIIRIEGGMADIAKRKMDARGNLTGMKSLGEFPVHSVVNMVAAMRGGSRATSAMKAGLYGSTGSAARAIKCPGCGSVITFSPPSFTECGTLCPVRDFVSDLEEHGRAVAIREWKAAGNKGPIPTQKKIEAVEAAHDAVARAGARMRYPRADHYIVRPIRNGTEWAVFYADEEDLLPGEGMTHAAAVKSAKRLAAESGARWRDFGDEVYAPSYDYTA